MAAATNYQKNRLDDFVFRGQAYTPPTTWYVGLFTAAPTAAGGGTEITGGSYARVGVACSPTAWSSTGGSGTTTNPSVGTSGTVSNNAAITFPTPTAGWGTAVWVGFFDAATGGNLCYAGQLGAAQSIVSGAPYAFQAGALAYQTDASF